MPQHEMNIGDYTLQALGSIDIQSSGPEVKMEACGAKSALTLSGATAATMQCGPAILALSNDAGAIGTVSLQAGLNGSVKLGVGLPHIGSFLTMEPDMLSLSVGPTGMGASIKLTPDSITFKVGEVSFTMSPLGITEEAMACSRKLAAEGHHFTAAETQLSVGVVGQSQESPMSKVKVDASLVVNSTLCNQSTAAACNVDSAMMSVT